ncbi:MAG TPA: hypothetical protein VD927_08740 [Chryseosolibacter sp.]|nr:hypothetical protein [Chryseosolibacter sp.]
MALSEHLEKTLKKKYEPSSMVTFKYKGNDVSLKTDPEGNGIMLFIGKSTRDGKINGERYARRLLKDRDGKIIKDHWERKGKATP